jgi:DNA-binding transcriptional regulator YiaG
MIPLHHFARTIRSFRAFVSWSQRDLAEAIPVSVRTLQRWEHGDVHAPFPMAKLRITELMKQYGYQPESKAS